VLKNGTVPYGRKKRKIYRDSSKLERIKTFSFLSPKIRTGAVKLHDSKNIIIFFIPLIFSEKKGKNLYFLFPLQLGRAVL
jgi:hypothetical protein